MEEVELAKRKNHHLKFEGVIECPLSFPKTPSLLDLELRPSDGEDWSRANLFGSQFWSHDFGKQHATLGSKFVSYSLRVFKYLR